MDMRQILCFGDSNTYGLIPGTANRYSWGTRWTSILDEKLQFYGYRVAEEGLCGRTTMFADAYRPGRSGIDMLPAILETHRPLELVVHVGGQNEMGLILHQFINCLIERKRRRFDPVQICVF